MWRRLISYRLSPASEVNPRNVTLLIALILLG